jgi:hypothetical protein
MVMERDRKGESCGRGGYLSGEAGRRAGVEFSEFLGITKCSSNQLHFSKWMASAADAETLSQSWSSASPVVDPCNFFH